ncbi:MAG TPA: helix-turn-helix domain-containing protein [Terrimicrobiaceae bacterium]
MRDYFVYLPQQPPGGIWGCTATSVGFARVKPHTKYPPVRHPADHHFEWSHGRILQWYQIIFISEGSGIFESEHTREAQAVDSGSLIILFPGVWHRYAPDAAAGWTEHWIECQGSIFDEAVRSGIVQPTQPILHTGLEPELLRCFERCHALAARGALANQHLLSTMGTHLLSVIGYLQSAPRFDRRIDELIERAHALIALRCQEHLSLPSIAAELGVSYSHLRQTFRDRIGISPKQYHCQVRLQKAQELLASTTRSVQEVADILGYHSAFQLSKQFKQHFGDAPQHWRSKQMRKDVRGAGAIRARRDTTPV